MDDTKHGGMITIEPSTPDMILSRSIAIYEPTCSLRWSKVGTLQQAWRNMNATGFFEDAFEWRDVPTEDKE